MVNTLRAEAGQRTSNDSKIRYMCDIHKLHNLYNLACVASFLIHDNYVLKYLSVRRFYNTYK